MGLETVESRMAVLAPASLINYGENNGGIDNFIAIAEEQTERSYFYQNADQAVALGALHLIQMKKDSEDFGSGGGGPIKSKKERTVSITYASMGSSSLDKSGMDYGSTKWGIMLMNLTQSTVVPDL